MLFQYVIWTRLFCKQTVKFRISFGNSKNVISTCMISNRTLFLGHTIRAWYAWMRGSRGACPLMDRNCCSNRSAAPALSCGSCALTTRLLGEVSTVHTRVNLVKVILRKNMVFYFIFIKIKSTYGLQLWTFFKISHLLNYFVSLKSI